MHAHVLPNPDPRAGTLLARLTPAPAPAAQAILALEAEAEPEATIAALTAALAESAEGTAVLLLTAGGATWPASRRLALLAAFTRHAALAHAARGVRVNAIALCAPGPAGWNAAWPDAGAIAAAPATADDVARLAWFLLATQSVTGQFVRLAA